MPAYLRGFDSSLHTRKDGKGFKVYLERIYDFLYFSLNFKYKSYVPLLLTFGYRIITLNVNYEFLSGNVLPNSKLKEFRRSKTRRTEFNKGVNCQSYCYSRF